MAAANTKDMTHGVPWRLIAGFAIPIFLTQQQQACANIGVGNPDRDYAADYAAAKA